MRHPSLIPLSHDHHHGLALALRCRKQSLGQLRPMGAEGLKARALEVSEFFSTNLVPHFRAEEEVLFPLLRLVASESVAIIDQLLTEHKQMRSLVQQLESRQNLSKTLFDLGDLLERHIRCEERELFPIYEERVTVKDAGLTGEKIRGMLAR